MVCAGRRIDLRLAHFHERGSGAGDLTRILFTIASFLVLSWADYSFVTPASAINYAIVALMGHYLLGELVSPARWMGIVLICLGVGLVGLTPTSTTRAIVHSAAEP